MEGEILQKWAASGLLEALEAHVILEKDEAHQKAFALAFCSHSPMPCTRLSVRGLASTYPIVESFLSQKAALARLERLDLSSNCLMSFSESIARDLLPLLASDEPRLRAAIDRLTVVRLSGIERWWDLAEEIGMAAVEVVARNRRLLVLDLTDVRFSEEVAHKMADQLEHNFHLLWLGRFYSRREDSPAFKRIDLYLLRNASRYRRAVWIKNIVLRRNVTRIASDEVVHRVCQFLFPQYAGHCYDMPPHLSSTLLSSHHQGHSSHHELPRMRQVRRMRSRTEHEWAALTPKATQDAGQMKQNQPSLLKHLEARLDANIRALAANLPPPPPSAAPCSAASSRRTKLDPQRTEYGRLQEHYDQLNSKKHTSATIEHKGHSTEKFNQKPITGDAEDAPGGSRTTDVKWGGNGSTHKRKAQQAADMSEFGASARRTATQGVGSWLSQIGTTPVETNRLSQEESQLFEALANSAGDHHESDDLSIALALSLSHP